MPDAAPRVRWGAVALFMALACAISWPLMGWRDLAPASYATNGVPLWLKPLLTGWGPGVAGLVCLALFRAGGPLAGAHPHVRWITLTGTSAWRSMVAVLVPVGLYAAYAAYTGRSSLGFGLVAGAHAALYGLGEELGWRGFLQDALRPLRAWQRPVVLGTIWGLWHFTSFVDGAAPGEAVLRMAVVCAVLIAASAAIGAAVDASRAVAVGVACHLWYTFVEMLGGSAWPLVAVCAGFTIFWVRRWKASAPAPPLSPA